MMLNFNLSLYYMVGYEIKESNKSSKSNKSMFNYSFLFFIIITIVIIFRNEELKKLIIILFSDKTFFLSFIGIIIFSIYNLNQSSEDEETVRIKNATSEAILGFIIAIMAYLDLTAASFWIIWFASYYLSK